MCTCGTTDHHIIANRQTADGIGVALWSDGAVTGRLGAALQGVPVARPRTVEAITASRAAGWMFAGDVALYDAAEIGALYDACRWAVARGHHAAAMRRRVVEVARPTVRPLWTVQSADRDGNPTERTWRLPRIRRAWAGLCVFDFPAKALRYQVFNVNHADTCTPTAFNFATLADLGAYLHSL